MKKFYILFLVSLFGLMSYAQTSREKTMPVTTSSKSALEDYEQAVKALNDVAVEKALNLFGEALRKDPDFFMANYQLATILIWNSSTKNFNYYANAAINCKEKLSPAEDLLRDAITQLKQNKEADVTGIGRRLVEMYPKDINSYSDLLFFQTITRDTVAQLETLNKAISMVDDPATFYNQLGYIYMARKQYDKAEAAFDKYIELDPENPNVYDSKGDYYMSLKEYRRAYESYMKANSIDKSWGLEKAQDAKQQFEKKEGRSLNIIPL
jgi:tetratricopeptide (TPR) repeat protein